MKDFVLVSYRPMADTETEAHLMVNNDAKVFIKLIAIDGAEKELIEAHDKLMSEPDVEGVVVLHYDSLKEMCDKLVEREA